jgi:hypothetical protein
MDAILAVFPCGKSDKNIIPKMGLYAGSFLDSRQVAATPNTSPYKQSCCFSVEGNADIPRALLVF